MPYVNIRVLRGVTIPQKRRLVGAVTTALVSILGKQPEHIHVVLDEIAPDDWGYAGRLTSERPAAGAARPARRRAGRKRRVTEAQRAASGG